MSMPAPTPDPRTAQSTPAASAIHRRVAVAGSGGVSATVIVVARRGQVWVSIMPPFTWEAILEPIKVDELIHTLGLAREDAKKMATAIEKRTSVPNRRSGPAPTSSHDPAKPGRSTVTHRSLSGD